MATGEVTGRQDHSAAPPMHVHTRGDECFYVIAGAITCYAGDEIFDVPAGSFVVLPRDAPHRYELAAQRAGPGTGTAYLFRVEAIR